MRSKSFFDWNQVDFHETALTRGTNGLYHILNERLHRERLVTSLGIPAPLVTVLPDTRSDAAKTQNRSVARKMLLRPESLLAYLHRAQHRTLAKGRRVRAGL